MIFLNLNFLRPGFQKFRPWVLRIGQRLARPPRIAAKVATDGRSFRNRGNLKFPELRNFESQKHRNVRNIGTSKSRNFENRETQNLAKTDSGSWRKSPWPKKAHFCWVEPVGIQKSQPPASGNWRIPIAPSPNLGASRDRRNSESLKLRNFRNSETSKVRKLGTFETSKVPQSGISRKLTKEVGEFQAARPKTAHFGQKLRRPTQETGESQSRPPEIAAEIATDFRSS